LEKVLQPPEVALKIRGHDNVAFASSLDEVIDALEHVAEDVADALDDLRSDLDNLAVVGPTTARRLRLGIHWRNRLDCRVHFFSSSFARLVGSALSPGRLFHPSFITSVRPSSPKCWKYPCLLQFCRLLSVTMDI
jgi:hypothetical protein